MESVPHDKFVRLAVTTWSIWHARRKAIHEAIFQSPHQTHIFINRFIDELGIVNDGNRRPRQTGAPTHEQRQSPKRPPPGYCKIHVDAGVRERQGGSAAAVCRDEAGHYLGASVLVIEGVTGSVGMPRGDVLGIGLEYPKFYYCIRLQTGNGRY